jgi:hypothetical protein
MSSPSRAGLLGPYRVARLERRAHLGVESIQASALPSRWTGDVLDAKAGLLGAGRHRLARLRRERGQPDPQRQQPPLEVLGRPQEALAAGSVRAPVLQLLPEGGDLRGQLAQFQL